MTDTSKLDKLANEIHILQTQLSDKKQELIQEEKRYRINAAQDVVNNISDFCSRIGKGCENCPFYLPNDYDDKLSCWLEFGIVNFCPTDLAKRFKEFKEEQNHD